MAWQRATSSTSGDTVVTIEAGEYITTLQKIIWSQSTLPVLARMTVKHGSTVLVDADLTGGAGQFDFPAVFSTAEYNVAVEVKLFGVLLSTGKLNVQFGQ